LLAQFILSGDVDFKGHPLIDAHDVKELDGNSPLVDEKWILFTTDGLCVEVFLWEEFEGVEKMPLLMGKSDLLQQEAILLLCNNGSSKHWFLIDSLPVVFIKSTALRREKKMMSFLQELQPLIDVGELSFCTKQT